VYALFVWLISHQPIVLFFQNKPATNNQPTILFSQNKSAPTISHQPNEQAGSASNDTQRHACLLQQPVCWPSDTATGDLREGKWNEKLPRAPNLNLENY
jgi:hypothetical protein